MNRSAPVARDAIPRRTVVWMAVIAVLFALHVRWLWFLCDDAFISFRYALNLVDGHGLVFNPGERVEGFSNFLWVLVSATLLKFGLWPESWIPWISAAIAELTLITAMWHLARRGENPVLFGLLLAANSGFAAWATGGLETAMFTALITGAFFLLADSLADPSSAAPDDARAVIRSAPLFLLASLTRPDGAAIAALAGLFLFGRALIRRLPWRTLAAWLLMWGLPVAGFLAWRFWYYGRLVPNTFFQRDSTWKLIPLGLQYLADAALVFQWPLLAIPALVLLAWRRRLGISRPVLMLSAAMCVPYLAYVCLVGGDFMDQFRFVVPVVPITILLAQRTWRGFADLLSEKAGPRISHAAIAVLAILLISFGGRASQQSLRVEFRHGRDSIGLSREYATNWSAIAAQITAMSEPGDTIAISAAGIIPYYSNLYTIDQLGLVASDLSRYTKRADPHPGHSLLLAGDILMEHPPQFLIGHPTVNRNRDSIDIIQRVSAEWFERQVPVYRTCVVQIADSPPLYTMFALRQDVSERFPQQPPLNGPE